MVTLIALNPYPPLYHPIFFDKNKLNKNANWNLDAKRAVTGHN